nr:uncharacterized mitochondrial protein AtMg00810-like [Tanacetum cinerariifolium]
MEELYVIQPEGFEKLGEEKNVYKLAKYFYSLRQAPKAWNIKLDNTLKERGFQQCMQEKAIYKAVTNEEFIIVAVYVNDLFVTGISLDCINEFKRILASQFEMLDLGESTYYLGIKVLQRKDCVEIKQERYARKILKEAGMEDCNATSYPMEKDLNDSSHNVDIDDGRSTTEHVFYLGTSPITWYSQKQTTAALSSCEAEIIAATAAAPINEGLDAHKVQGDEIVTWYARVTIFDSEIQEVIFRELSEFHCGLKPVTRFRGEARREAQGVEVSLKTNIGINSVGSKKALGMKKLITKAGRNTL